MIRPKKQTEDFLRSFTKTCETLIRQFHRKPQEKFEFELTETSETFSFKPSNILGIDSNWPVGLIALKAYTSIFSIAERNIKFEFYTDSFDESSFTDLKGELEEIFDISNFSHEHLQDKKTERRTFKAYKKLETEKRRNVCYYI